MGPFSVSLSAKWFARRRNARIFAKACGHRWPRPPHGSALLHRRQVHSERQQSGRCALRGHQHERQLLQEQDEVSEVPATPVQCEAAQGSLSFPCAFKIFWRTVRGMIPHKSERGKEALKRLQTFEGIPPPYDKKKRMVITSALRVLRLKPGRKSCSLGRLSHEVGWKYQDVIETL